MKAASCVLLLVGSLGVVSVSRGRDPITLDGTAPRADVRRASVPSTAAPPPRLLIEYPEPQARRSSITCSGPTSPAAFQHLKVEVGGDVNSTDGCEPSHMHARDEENYQRG